MWFLCTSGAQPSLIERCHLWNNTGYPLAANHETKNMLKNIVSFVGNKRSLQRSLPRRKWPTLSRKGNNQDGYPIWCHQWKHPSLEVTAEPPPLWTPLKHPERVLIKRSCPQSRGSFVRPLTLPWLKRCPHFRGSSVHISISSWDHRQCLD